MILPEYEQHPEAADELGAAVRWYADRNWDVADVFVERVRTLLDDLRDWPRSGRAWLDWHREPQVYSYGVKGYPYRIVYFLRDDEPVVVAFAHDRQRPGYWKHRLDN